MAVLHLLGSRAEGGAETYFAELVVALQADGGDQAAAIRAHAVRTTALTFAGVPTRVLGFGSPLDLLTRPRAAAFARERNANVLLAWMNRAAQHTPKGSWARVGRLGGYYALKNYQGFDHLVGNTAAIADWIVGQGWPAARVSHIPNFAEAGAAGQTPADLRAELTTPEGAPLLLGMGRLHPSKAHDVTLRALAKLPGIWLWVAGDGPEAAALRALASELGVTDRVRWLGWRGDAAALYRAADVVVFPSRFEPLGNVVLQAWAHGTPIVAAASDGPAALIRDAEDGRLTSIDDPVQLAATAANLLADSAQRRRLAAAGLARVATEFSKGAVVAQWRTLFAQLGGG